MVHRPPQGNDGRQLLYDRDHLEPYLPAEKQDLSPVMEPTVVKAMAMTHGRDEVKAVAGQRVTEIKRVPLAPMAEIAEPVANDRPVLTVTKTMRGKSMALEARPLMARGPMKSERKSSSGRR